MMRSIALIGSVLLAATSAQAGGQTGGVVAGASTPLVDVQSCVQFNPDTNIASIQQNSQNNIASCIQAGQNNSVGIIQNGQTNYGTATQFETPPPPVPSPN